MDVGICMHGQTAMIGRPLCSGLSRNHQPRIEPLKLQGGEEWGSRSTKEALRFRPVVVGGLTCCCPGIDDIALVCATAPIVVHLLAVVRDTFSIERCR